jgi:hypothetical protein
MEVQLSVFDPNEDHVISFGDYQFAHVGCGAMTNKFVQAHDEQKLVCACGLEVHLLRFGEAVAAITQAVIDGQPRLVPPEGFHSNLASAIRVFPRGAA